MIWARPLYFHNYCTFIYSEEIFINHYQSYTFLCILSINKKIYKNMPLSGELMEFSDSNCRELQTGTIWNFNTILPLWPDKLGWPWIKGHNLFFLSQSCKSVILQQRKNSSSEILKMLLCHRHFHIPWFIILTITTPYIAIEIIILINIQ